MPTATDTYTPPTPTLDGCNWTPHTYRKAEALDDKARNLLAKHRHFVWHDDPTLVRVHGNARRRIMRLMAPYWRAESDARASAALLRRWD